MGDGVTSSQDEIRIRIEQFYPNVYHELVWKSCLKDVFLDPFRIAVDKNTSVAPICLNLRL